MKKLCSISLSLLLGLVLLTSCGTKALPEGLLAADVESSAKQVLDTMNSRDFETLSTLVASGKLTPEEWDATITPILEKTGEFIEFGKVETLGQETDGVQYAVALVSCTYENGPVIFRIVFDTDMAAQGLWVEG